MTKDGRTGAAGRKPADERKTSGKNVPGKNRPGTNHPRSGDGKKPQAKNPVRGQIGQNAGAKVKKAGDSGSGDNGKGKDRLNLQNIRLLTAGNTSQFPKDGKIQIAFSGRSNVGKSSLINAVLGRKSLARVSSSPGKTITINFYEVDGKIYLCDLPGYGYAKRSLETKERFSSLADGYFRLCAPAVVLQLVDLKAGATEDDLMMLDFLERSRIPYYIITTKTDKLNATQRSEALMNIPLPGEDSMPGVDPEKRIIPFSALSGEGKEEVRNVIFRFGNAKR